MNSTFLEQQARERINSMMRDAAGDRLARQSRNASGREHAWLDQKFQAVVRTWRKIANSDRVAASGGLRKVGPRSR